MKFSIGLGKSETVNVKNIVGIFDMDNATVEEATRGFLKKGQESFKVVNLANDIPKSFVVTDNGISDTIYISGKNAKVLAKI